MKTMHLNQINILRRITILWLLLGVSLCPASPLCEVIESWTRLNERLYQEGLALGQNLKNKLDGDPAISAHARFQNHPGGLSPKMAAQQQIDEALGAAEAARPGIVGNLAANEFVEVATTSRVVSSNISYEIMGRGYGQMGASAADAGITKVDEYMALVFQKQRIKFQHNAEMLASDYNEASFLRAWTRLFDSPGNLQVAKQVHVDLMSGGNDGMIGNVHSASVLKSRGMTIEYLDPDQLTGTPFEQVDILTPDFMIQTGLTSQTIRGKIGATKEDAIAMALAIKNMESLQPSRLFKFSYMHGEPADFDNVIGYLNEALADPDVGHNRVFTRNDFIKTPWNE